MSLSNGARRGEAPTRWIQLEEPGLRAYIYYSRPFELFEELRISKNLQPEAQIMAAEIKGTNEK